MLLQMDVTRSRRPFIYAEYFEAAVTRPFEPVFAFVLLDYSRIQFLGTGDFRNNRGKKSRSPLVNFHRGSCVGTGVWPIWNAGKNDREIIAIRVRIETRTYRWNLR